jgi:NAD(P)-dependent dehydrogenase (short-subunit alcohol dehydrogenase family)
MGNGDDMTDTLIWISGASSGIGEALARTVPWPGARIINISRTGTEGTDHVEADLSHPSSWPAVAESFEKELAGFEGERVVFVHAAGTVQPMGFAAEVDTGPYTAKVLLNSAAPQVLGHLFIKAVRDVRAERHLLMLTSGAAKSVYPGWSAYGAGKAAIDSWVRDVGAEQAERGGVQVLSVAPGTVATGMQAQIRETPEEQFPNRQKFVDLHQSGNLSDPEEVAGDIWKLLERDIDNGSVVDLRELDG